MTFITNLKSIREEKCWTQNEVCKRLAESGYYLDRTSYSRYENGSRIPSAETLKYLAVCFGVSADYLLCLSDKK